MTRLFAVVCMVVAMNSGLYAVDPLATQKSEVLTAGQKLPEFESVDDAGVVWKSADHLGHIVVFYFYPGDFTSGCIKQAQSFREGLKSLEDLDIEVVGISGDQAATHQLFKQAHGLRHTLLADPEGKVATQLGIPVRRSEKAATVRAVDLDRKPVLDGEGKPITFERTVTFPRWTIIVDRDGKLVSNRTKVNPSSDADEVRKIVEALPK